MAVSGRLDDDTDYKGSAAMRVATRTLAVRESSWMTPRQAAAYLGVGIDTIYDACAAGGLKHVKLGHRTIRAATRMG